MPIQKNNSTDDWSRVCFASVKGMFGKTVKIVSIS